jgi:hypothetical protein
VKKQQISVASRGKSESQGRPLVLELNKETLRRLSTKTGLHAGPIFPVSHAMIGCTETH